MRRLIASLALAAGFVAVLGAITGCAPKLTGALKANKAPHTRIFVEGPVDSVNHVVHLHWLGTDEDGYVRGYEFKVVNPLDTVAADSAWRTTTNTDSLFTIYSPQGGASPVLYVRSIDNEGAKDAVPARQPFLFRNTAPIVKLILKPNRTDKSDSTYASVTVSWTITDPDGDSTKAVYQVWLDGNQATPEVTTESRFTMPSDRFLQGGTYKDGFRTLYVRAIDDGGMAGPPDTVRWFVRQPRPGAGALGSTHARLLIVDDVPKGANSGFRNDTLFYNAANRAVGVGNWSVLQLETTIPFHSAKDMEQTFKLFDAVVWYRGGEITIPNILFNYQDGLGAYLTSGGKLFLEGLYLFRGLNAEGGLTDDFATQYLDCDGFRKCFQNALQDSSIGWGNSNGSKFFSTMYADSSLQQGLSSRTSPSTPGVRVFNVRQKSEIAFVGAPGAVTPALAESLAVGVSVPQPNGGRAVIMTVPIETSLPVVNGPAPRILAKIFAQLGLF